MTPISTSQSRMKSSASCPASSSHLPSSPLQVNSSTRPPLPLLIPQCPPGLSPHSPRACSKYPWPAGHTGHLQGTCVFERGSLKNSVLPVCIRVVGTVSPAWVPSQQMPHPPSWCACRPRMAHICIFQPTRVFFKKVTLHYHTPQPANGGLIQGTKGQPRTSSRGQLWCNLCARVSHLRPRLHLRWDHILAQPLPLPPFHHRFLLRPQPHETRCSQTPVSGSVSGGTVHKTAWERLWEKIDMPL